MIKPISNTTTASVNQQSQLQAASNSNNFSSILNKVTSKEHSNNVQTLDGIFEKAAQTYNVPLNLLKSVAKAESGFRADALSKCGAQGIMQLMPQTAKELGVSNAFDPYENIMGGAKCLSQKLKLYNGDLKLTLASYNAGSGNVKKYGGIPPFPETKNYVQKVLGYMNGDLSSGILVNNSKPSATQSKNIAVTSDTAYSGESLSSSIASLKTTAMMMQYEFLQSNLNLFNSEDEGMTASSSSNQSNAQNNSTTTFAITDYQRFLQSYNTTQG